jgi:hypothetical protein
VCRRDRLEIAPQFYPETADIEPASRNAFSIVSTMRAGLLYTLTPAARARPRLDHSMTAAIDFARIEFVDLE